MSYFIKGVFEGHKGFVRCCLYFSKYNRLVTCSFDRTIRIWDTKTTECVKILKNNTDVVYHLIKWNEDVFLSCCGDDRVLEYSVESMELKREIYKRSIFGDVCKRMLKLDDETLLFVGHGMSTTIFNLAKILPETVALKQFRFDRMHTNVFTKLVLSKMKTSEHKYFYMNCSIQSKYEILLLKAFTDWRSEAVVEVEMKFQGHVNSIFSITTYVDSKGKEVLVAAGGARVLYFYKRYYSKMYSRYFRRINVSDVVYCFLVVSNKFLFVGHKKGILSCFLLHDGSTVKKFERKVHCQGIELILPSTDENESSEGCIELFTCSYDKTVKLFRAIGNSLESADFSERKKFLLNDLNEVEDGRLFSISIYLVGEIRIFKSMC